MNVVAMADQSKTRGSTTWCKEYYTLYIYIIFLHVLPQNEPQEDLCSNHCDGKVQGFFNTSVRQSLQTEDAS